ncbi:MAG: hypothetical protein ACKPH6_06705, partial [Microcystis panniformis]
PTVTDFVHNVGANCVRPKGTLSKRKSLTVHCSQQKTPHQKINFIGLPRSGHRSPSLFLADR